MNTRTKILVVDEDLHSLSRIYLNLLHRKYKVDICNDGNEAMTHLKKLKPSILIIDQEFYPGIEKKLKIPAIVLTNEYSNSDIRELDDLKLVSKPVQTEKLMKAVQSLEV